MCSILKNRFRASFDSLEAREMLSANPILGLGTGGLVAAPGHLRQLAPAVAIDYGHPASTTAKSASAMVRSASLVDVVNAFTITNNTANVVNFYIRWSANGSWQFYSLKPGYHQTYYNFSVATATISFDYSFSAGYQEHRYALATQGQVLGPNGRVGLGKQYVFLPIYNGVELYRKA